MIPIILLAALGAVAILLSDDKAEETPPKPKSKKYSKAFVLAAGRWLKENKPPEDWDGSKLEYAATEMTYDGDVYE